MASSFFEVRAVRRLADRFDCELRDRHLKVERLEERTRRLGRFDDPMRKPARDRDRSRREHVRRRHRTEQVRHQVERASHLQVRGPRTSMPCARSIWLSAMSGRPINAVGSSLSMRSKSAMPSASDLTAPAQS